jgi:uncharacterized repeat protein (TIGR03803 family)
MRFAQFSISCVGLLFLAVITAAAQPQYKVIYSFGASQNDASYPNGGLVFDNQGNLYGTSQLGGLHGCMQECGTIFQLTPSPDGTWTENVIYEFCSEPNCADGGNPGAGLVSDSAGNLYGTTRQGSTGCGVVGCGTVFELSPPLAPGGSWSYTVLWNFGGNDLNDGAIPSGRLTWGVSGNLFGTTEIGGANQGEGTVFELSPAQAGGWNESVLYTFCPNGLFECGDGAGPLAGVSLDASGNLYGTTFHGGAEGEWGVLYKLSPDGNAGAWAETVLYKFLGRSGANPSSAVNFDQSGNAYVTAYDGLFEAACGGVFKFQPKGRKQSRLFLTGESGCNPLAGVSIDPRSGNLYGTASTGGKNGSGSIYEVSETGRLSTIYSFCSQPNCADGQAPIGNLDYDAGKIYSTTSQGGAFNQGVVFEVTP